MQIKHNYYDIFVFFFLAINVFFQIMAKATLQRVKYMNIAVLIFLDMYSSASEVDEAVDYGRFEQCGQ